MGKRWIKLREVWKAFKAFWHRNLMEYYKAVSINLGICIVIILTALISPLSDICLGRPPNWGIFSVITLVAVVEWVSFLVTSILGKKEQLEE